MTMAERIKIAALNIYFYTFFFIVSTLGVAVLTLIVASTRLFLSGRKTMKRFRRAINWYGTIITSIPYPFIKVRFEDRSGTDRTKGSIFVCNHRSTSDAFLISVLPVELVQIVNIWPFRIPILGFYARLAGYINIRMMPHEEFMEMAGKLLAEGVSIVFFPEGTRSASRKMGSFHGAAFRLALATKAPIVPLCLSGTENIPPKGSLMLRPGTITVRSMPAITWSEYKNLNAFAFKNRVWNMIDSELKIMEGGEARGAREVKPQDLRSHRPAPHG